MSRRRTRTTKSLIPWTAVTVGIFLMVPVLPAAAQVPDQVPAATPAAEPTPEAETDEETAARDEARATGQPVEVTGRTDERTRVIVTSEGHLTMEMSAVALRAKVDGVWKPVDLTLERRADGSVGPRVSPVDLSFSGGGASPLATLAADGVSVSMGWLEGQRPLPAPVLEADTATYREVLPGVDLQVRANAESFSEVLVVKDRRAANNPALRELVFPMQVPGGKLSRTSEGGLAIADDAGEVVMGSPAPLMWDSSGTGAAGAGPRPGGNQGKPGSAGASAEHSPSEGDRVAGIGLEVAGRGMTLRPDAKLLAASDITFPLYIDPVVQAGRQRWAMVNRSYPTTSYVNWTAASEGMGYNSYSGINLKRLFWQFDTMALHGKQVMSATFAAFQEFAATCVASDVSLHLTGPMGSTVTWNNQPGWHEHQGTANVAAGRPECGGPRYVEFDASKAVRTAAGANWPNVTLGLKANDEGSNNGWKRFRSDAVLSVRLNTPPPAPTNIGTVTPYAPCRTGALRPVIGGSGDLTLRAHLHDPDGDGVTAHFGVYPDTELSQTKASFPVVGRQGPGPVTYLLKDYREGIYVWHVRTEDGYGSGPLTPNCEFEVDRTAPAVKPTVTSDYYPAAPQFGGAPGNAGTFRLDPAGVSDVVSYQYWLDNEQAGRTVAKAADTTIVSARPMTAGPHTLHVRSVDRAGNLSPIAAYGFKVRSVAPRDIWGLNGSGTSEPSTGTSAKAQALTLTPTVGMATPRHGADQSSTTDRSRVFNGADTCASTATAGLSSADGFTVGAHVNVNQLRAAPPAGAVTVLSHDGPSGPAVKLGYDGSTDSLFFSVGGTKAQVAANDGTWYLDDAELAYGGWLHLAGTYDPVQKQVLLYVFGEQAGSATGPAAPPGLSGALRIGCAVSGAATIERFAGNVDLAITYDLPQAPAVLKTLASMTIESSAALQQKPPADASASASLSGGQILTGSQTRFSPNGSYVLRVSTDGRVMVRSPHRLVWQSPQAAGAGATATVSNGQLLLKNSSGAVVATYGSPTPGAALVVGDGGELRLGAWSSGVVEHTELRQGGVLRTEHRLVSPDGRYVAVMQADGNLVTYGPYGTVWGSWRFGNGAIATLQSDGNFVVYTPAGAPIFASGTGNGHRLVMQDDGNLVLYPVSGAAVWWTGGYP